MRRAGVLCLALVACGRVGFDAELDGGSSAGDACALDKPGFSSFTDDFSDGVFPPDWETGSSCMMQTGGELVAPMTPNLATPLYCLAATTSLYRIACDAVTVHVPETTRQALGVQTDMYLTNDAHAIQLINENGGFQLGYDKMISTTQVSDGYDATADAWWRLRGDADHVYFDTSPDGTAWNNRMTLGVPFTLDALYLTLTAGTYKPVGDPGTARFRCLNLPPSSCP